jgi:hypothetical protein
MPFFMKKINSVSELRYSRLNVGDLMYVIITDYLIVSAICRWSTV